MRALQNLPEEFLDRYDRLHTSLDRANILTYEDMTPRGMMMMNEKSHDQNFYKATDQKSIYASHQDVPDVKVADLEDYLDPTDLRPLITAFSATVTYVESQCTEHGTGGDRGDLFTIVPCGWSLKAALGDNVEDKLSGEKFATSGDVGELVYNTYHFTRILDKLALEGGSLSGFMGDLNDPVPVAPSEGCCFGAVGNVVKVEGKNMTLHIQGKATRFNKGWEKRCRCAPEG